MTPYRRGMEAGRESGEAFKVWNEAARAAGDWSNRPETPACPYTNRHSATAWREGFQRAYQLARGPIAPRRSLGGSAESQRDVAERERLREAGVYEPPRRR
jgi:uncharacterized protein YcaQ